MPDRISPFKGVVGLWARVLLCARGLPIMGTLIGLFGYIVTSIRRRQQQQEITGTGVINQSTPYVRRDVRDLDDLPPKPYTPTTPKQIPAEENPED